MIWNPGGYGTGASAAFALTPNPRPEGTRPMRGRGGTADASAGHSAINQIRNEASRGPGRGGIWRSGV